MLTIWPTNPEISVESEMERTFFLENPFGICRLLPEVVLIFVRNGTVKNALPFAKLSSFQSLISRQQLREIELQMVSAISFGWFADFGKTLTIIHWSS